MVNRVYHLDRGLRAARGQAGRLRRRHRACQRLTVTSLSRRDLCRPVPPDGLSGGFPRLRIAPIAGRGPSCGPRGQFDHEADVMDLLKLIALDGDDVGVCLGASAGRGRGHRRRALAPGRAPRGDRPQPFRLGRRQRRSSRSSGDCRAALRFERVMACQCRNVDAGGPRTGAQPARPVFDESDPPRRNGDADVLRRQGAAAPGGMPGGGAGRSRTGWTTDYCPAHPVDNDRRQPRGFPRVSSDDRAAAGLTRGRPRAITPHPAILAPAGPLPMPIRLDSRSPDFAARFDAFLDAKRETAADVEQAVRGIVADVRARGDAALIELTRRFDRVDLEKVRICAFRPRSSRPRTAACEPRALDALRLARDRIEAYHRRQLPGDDRFTDALGVELGHRWTAIEAVGLYVPGGTAAYPSSVLMNAVPAKVAGVPRAGHGGARTRRPAVAAGPGCGQARRHRRNLSHRRRPSGRGAGLWDRNDPPGRQDRRAGQCLCRHRQAAGVRQGRHRHDRRPLRSSDPG